MTSSYAAEGTAAHVLAARALAEKRAPAEYVGETIVVHDTEHHPLSPSGAYRWAACPGSAAMIAATSQAKKSAPAEVEVTHEMAEAVATYIEALDDIAQGSPIMVEQKLPLEDVLGVPGARGTADALVLHPEELQIHDLKYGRGVKVAAEENAQLLLYAAGALSLCESIGAEVSAVRLVIHQPRRGGVSEWTVSAEELRAKARALAEAAQRAHRLMQAPRRDVEAALAPGSHCRFCDALARCPAARERVEAEIADAFEATPPVEDYVSALPAAELARLRSEVVPFAEAWVKAICAEVEARVLRGEQVPGFKAVQGRAKPRRWTDEDDAIAALIPLIGEDKALKVSVISPAEVEKIDRKLIDRLKQIIVQDPGALTVVEVSDKRPEVPVPDVISAFD